MRSVQVSIEVLQPPEEVYDFLDVMAHHEPFTNHMMSGWEYSGPVRGVGSKARVQVTAAGRTDMIDIEVVSAERPATIVERNIGAGGRRIATGTYTLTPLPGGGTRIAFKYAWQQVPLSERLAAPLIRRFLRRGNQHAMRRLAEQLAARPGAGAVADAA